MKKSTIILILFINICSHAFAQQASVKIIPEPVSVVQHSGSVTLTGDVALVARTDDQQNIAMLLQDFLKSKNIKSHITKTTPARGSRIAFSFVKNESFEGDGYQLTTNEEGVAIDAHNATGLFYGMQSLFQLFSSNGKTDLPLVTIIDQPRFNWRGLHLDVGRHFFPVTFIKKYIDAMSHYKLNTFHWHLTEDQGWRIEIKKYPKLQEIAAFRKETVVGKSNTRTRNEPHQYDGIRHGGYYTQDEVKEVVAYAAQRYVTVVPEIEMPGHALAALAAYPYLGCTGGPYEVATTWGIFDDVYCAGKETTFQFLQDVLDEVIPLFPGKYIHVGGDECPKTKWEKCPYCNERMKNEKLRDTHALQSYFIQRMEQYINGKGKQIVGWDEILEGGLAPNATVMSWRGEEGGIAAAQQDHDVIMTPSKWLYLDYYQDTSRMEPLAIGGFVPVSKIYSYEPVSSQLAPDQQKYILGTQANVWTEYIPNEKHVEYMVYPRAIALSEIAWSPKEKRNYEKFIERLKSNRWLLDFWGINYAKHVFEQPKK